MKISYENIQPCIDNAHAMQYNRYTKQRRGFIFMSATTNVSIRMNVDLKRQAEELFSDLGLNMTTAFNIFVRQSLTQGKIPFEILSAPDPFYSNKNMRVLEKSVQELKDGKIVVKTMDELRAMEWSWFFHKPAGKIICIDKQKTGKH